VLQHLSNAYISGFELPSETKVFEMASRFFGKFVDPNHTVYM